MGEKDFQQLKIVEDFVKKNYKNINIVKSKTIREKNGTAMSSRNALLTKNEKNISGYIYNYIKINKTKILNNFFTKNFVKINILTLGAVKIDYLKIIDINKIVKPYIKKKKERVFVAYYLGSTRLIDNI